MTNAKSISAILTATILMDILAIPASAVEARQLEWAATGAISWRSENAVARSSDPVAQSTLSPPATRTR